MCGWVVGAYSQGVDMSPAWRQVSVPPCTSTSCAKHNHTTAQQTNTFTITTRTRPRRQQRRTAQAAGTTHNTNSNSNESNISNQERNGTQHPLFAIVGSRLRAIARTTHPPTPCKNSLISKHAPEIGFHLARRVIRNVVLAFSRARDLRTGGGSAARISEPSREPRRPGAGRPGPPLLRAAAARRQRGMPCAAHRNFNDEASHASSRRRMRIHGEEGGGGKHIGVGRDWVLPCSPTNPK